MTGNFAEVYLNNLKTSEINPSFDYLIPQSLKGKLHVGQLVLVPFKNRLEIGIVCKVKNKSSLEATVDSLKKLREIIQIIESDFVLDQTRLKFAHWLAYYYVSSIGSALKLFFPPKFNYKIIKQFEFDCTKLNEKYHITETLNSKEYDKNYISKILKKYNFLTQIDLQKKYEEKKFLKLLNSKYGYSSSQAKRVISLLKKNGIIKETYVLSEPIFKPIYITYYKLKREFYFQEDDDYLKKHPAQKRIVDYLKLNNNKADKNSLLRENKTTIKTLNELVKHGYLIKENFILKRDFAYNSYGSLLDDVNNDEIILNKDQEKSVKEICYYIGKKINKNFLIEGVAGSGKTEVYIRCVKEALDKNQRALILTPEISLIPQLYSRFVRRFKEDCTVYHSAMSDNERYEKYKEIQQGKAKVIIGTRSALFTPISNLGLIIIDEAHDVSYKENFGLRYSAIESSLKLGELLKIPVVLGSATPAVELKYKFECDKNCEILKLPQKIFKDNKIFYEIVDLKKIDNLIEDEIITNKLYTAILETIKNKEKAIIFINRRGYSNYIVCGNCGFIPKCENCNLPYTYHLSNKTLKCHHCNKEITYNGVCLSCGSKKIKMYGTGIQKVEAKLKQRFDDVKIVRMDSDVTGRKKSHEKILKEFIENKPSILIGTQMVTKGLDIKDVTLVGVINIDSMYSLPDYHINERVYQLLTQVSGRTGRGIKDGKVIIQTFNPDNLIIKNLLNNNFDTFYKEEIYLRQSLKYPPFSRLINIILTSEKYEIAKSASKELYELINTIKNVKGKDDIFCLLGPSPAPFPKINRNYRWHILVKVFKLNEFISRFTKLLGEFKIEKDLRLIIDVDPYWIL